MTQTYQIAIAGQYMENYGIHDWDGEGDCPQFWKPKHGSALVLVDCVAEADLAFVAAQLYDRLDAFSWNEMGSSMSYDSFVVYPSGIGELDKIPLDYQDIDYVTTISRAAASEFLANRKRLLALVNNMPADPAEPSPLPYEHLIALEGF